ncbi:MAG: hypothetical protein HRU51_05605 [Xanthomonadales bacterium]|nr:hypothetical protein [Xanthomonadales bacterium]
MNKLLATSVVRGSEQGQSHGGVYLIDLQQQTVQQKIDWNTMDIDWEGRGADRGLRGIAFTEDRVYIAASDELFAYTPDFEPIGSWRCPHLKHCHEIACWQGSLFLTSTAYDSILAFDLEREQFHWALHVDMQGFRFKGTVYDPMQDQGPLMLNKLHLNNVACRQGGLYMSGLKSGGMLHFNSEEVSMAATLPAGTHNAQPFRDGVLFNDTQSDVLRYCGRGEGDEDRALPVPKYDPAELTHQGIDDSRLARQGFARGLCVLSERVVAGGSSPSTVTLYDLKASRQLMSVRISTDIRNAIHGLAVWPWT